MNSGRTVPSRALFAVAISLLLGVGIRAAETATRSTASTAPAEQRDSIGAAKREFDAFKATRDPSSQQKAALPRVTMPELQPDGAQTNPLSPAKSNRPDAAAKKSANWLVDAMEKSEREEKLRKLEREGRGDSRRELAEEDELALLRPTASQNEAASPSKSSEETERVVAETKEKPNVVNPLTQYLGDWMTPRDYAVLKSGLEDSGSGGSPREFRTAESLRVDSPSAFGIGSATTIGATSARPAGFPPPPRENPYLQGIVTPAATLPPSPALLSPPAPLPSSPAANAPIMAPLPPPVFAPPSKVPDFAKPAHDEKYFKQLKRF